MSGVSTAGFLTTAEAAEALGVRYEWMRRAILREGIERHRIGLNRQTLYIREEDVEALREKMTAVQKVEGDG